jgi:hypothetical protein
VKVFCLLEGWQKEGYRLLIGVKIVMLISVLTASKTTTPSQITKIM